MRIYSDRSCIERKRRTEVLAARNLVRRDNRDVYRTNNSRYKRYGSSRLDTLVRSYLSGDHCIRFVLSYESRERHVRNHRDHDDVRPPLYTYASRRTLRVGGDHSHSPSGDDPRHSTGSWTYKYEADLEWSTRSSSRSDHSSSHLRSWGLVRLDDVKLVRTGYSVGKSTGRHLRYVISNDWTPDLKKSRHLRPYAPQVLIFPPPRHLTTLPIAVTPLKLLEGTLILHLLLSVTISLKRLNELVLRLLPKPDLNPTLLLLTFNRLVMTLPTPLNTPSPLPPRAHPWPRASAHPYQPVR